MGRTLLPLIAIALFVVALAPRTAPRASPPPPPRPALPSLEACAPLRFAVLGDGRAAMPGLGPSAYKVGVLREVLARAPAFVVDTGDLVMEGEDPREWARLLATLPAETPYLAVRGNHDVGGFYDNELAPGPVYGRRVGPVWLVGFDTEGVHDHDVRARIGELDATLGADDAPWKIVVMHRPVWSSGPHGGDERGLNAALVPVLDRHHVAVVFSGHDHHYERFCASLGVDRRCAPEGTVYVVTGGAGTFTNHWAFGAEPGRRAFSGSRHFVEVEVADGELRLTARRTRVGNLRRAEIIDRITLRRPARCG